MNLNIEDLNLSIYASYNQTNTFVCFGTFKGFYVFLINPFRKIIFREIDGGVSIVKMLYDTNIFLFVGRSESGPYPNNKLIIWDDDKKIVLTEITYNTPILNIDITKNHIVVCVKDTIFIYNFHSIQLITSISTSFNPKGIMAVSPGDNEFIAYPSDKTGYINICKLNNNNNLSNTNIFSAHNSSIDNIYISSNGQFIVTASEKGTILRIFNSTDFEKIKEFRRGSEYATIRNISMNHNNTILLVSSDKGTIHLYNTEIDPNFIYKNKKFNNFGINYIKFALPEYFNSEWSFTQFHLKNILSYSCFDKDTFRIFSICNDGQFYILNFENNENSYIEKTIRFISDSSDPFEDRNTTIK